MELTQNDVAFLQQVRVASKQNREEDNKVAIVTNRGLLSDQLLRLFEVEKTHTGAWFFNVYVEFEPMHKLKPAEDWQK